VLAGSLVIGTFLSPTFMLSLAGAVLSLGAMGLGRLAAGGALSALGYSVLGAMGHMLGQVLAAYLLFIPHPALFQLLPVLLSFALLFGLVSGRIALALVRRMPADA
jgi:heptaprenyl diphosphate synthase